MPSDLEFTGERFVPGVAGEIAHEHWHRYAFARRFVAGQARARRRVRRRLRQRAARERRCGGDRRRHRRRRRRACARRATRRSRQPALRAGSRRRAAAARCERRRRGLVRDRSSIFRAPDQPRMLAEFARVLAPDGVLVLSAPNRSSTRRRATTAIRSTCTSPTRGARRAARRCVSRAALVPAAPLLRVRGLERGRRGADCRGVGGRRGAASTPRTLPAAMYFVVVAARDAGGAADAGRGVSLFSDRDEGELARIDAQAARGHAAGRPAARARRGARPRETRAHPPPRGARRVSRAHRRRARRAARRSDADGSRERERSATRRAADAAARAGRARSARQAGRRAARRMRTPRARDRRAGAHHRVPAERAAGGSRCRGCA